MRSAALVVLALLASGGLARVFEVSLVAGTAATAVLALGAFAWARDWGRA